jgi:hypothetical protein
MLRIIVRIFQLQFFGFLLLLICCSIVGQEKGAFWYVLIVDMLLILTVVGKIAQRRSRRFNPKSVVDVFQDDVAAPTLYRDHMLCNIGHRIIHGQTMPRWNYACDI